MNYRKLEAWQLARELSIDLHELSFQLPSYEQKEEGRQLRKAIKSVRSSLVEGFGKRHFPDEQLEAFMRAAGRNEAAINHLETLFETGSLTDDHQYTQLRNRLNLLSIKIHRQISGLLQETLA